MEKIRILCYGDSNTWGYISGTDHQRYGDGERWTKLLASLLGDGFEVIEEGLNSRTLLSIDPRPGREGRRGLDYLIPCLDTHDPIDLVILMLGTNELKASYGRSAEWIGDTLEEYFVKTILGRRSQLRGARPKLLIVAPPAVDGTRECCAKGGIYEGAPQKSVELEGIYRGIAERRGCLFLSALPLATGVDGVHLTAESHRRLAGMLCERIKEEFRRE